MKKELKYQRGDLVKILEPPTEEEKERTLWDDTDQKLAGSIGRVVDGDPWDELLQYEVRTHHPADDHGRFYPEEYLKPAKKWEVKRYEREKKK